VFTIIGSLLATYTCYAVATGRVWAKAGPGAEVVWRSLSPRYFWIVIGIYGALSAALVFWF
jgi:hypothetical protein